MGSSPWLSRSTDNLPSFFDGSREGPVSYHGIAMTGGTFTTLSTTATIPVKQSATLDASFWINAVAGGLLDFVLDDFVVSIAPAVERELPETYPSGARLHRLIEEGHIALIVPTRVVLERFGPGERAAISVAMEHREWTLLLDDLRPFRAAGELGLTPVSTPAYAASLYERRVLDEVEVLLILARLAARGTVSPQLIALALTQVATVLQERR